MISQKGMSTKRGCKYHFEQLEKQPKTVDIVHIIELYLCS